MIVGFDTYELFVLGKYTKLHALYMFTYFRIPIVCLQLF